MNISKTTLYSLIDVLDEYDNKLVYDFLSRLASKKDDYILTDYLNAHCEYVD